jgi:small subunit ribosomal protein S7
MLNLYVYISVGSNNKIMRGKQAKQREIKPDPVYGSVLVAKFTNLVMQRGKKNLARNIVYTVLEKAEKEHNKPGVEVFEEVLDKVRPNVVLKARRVGGSNFQVPTPIEREKGMKLAMRWLLEAARKRKGAPIVDDLLKEMNDVLAGQGDLIKKREDTHRMAEANKAFSHFR